VTSRNLWKRSSTVHVMTKIAGSTNDDKQEGNDGLMHKSVDGFQSMEFPINMEENCVPLQCENVFVYGLAVVFKHPVNQSNVNENMFAEFF